MVAPRVVAGDGADVTHEGIARLRPADHGNRRLLLLSVRGERSVWRSIARQCRTTFQMAGRAQPLVVQLDDDPGCANRNRVLRYSIRDLEPLDAFRSRALPGLSRECPSILRAFRPSRAYLPVRLRHLPADGAVVGA